MMPIFTVFLSVLILRESYSIKVSSKVVVVVVVVVEGKSFICIIPIQLILQARCNTAVFLLQYRSISPCCQLSLVC